MGSLLGRRHPSFNAVQRHHEELRANGSSPKQNTEGYVIHNGVVKLLVVGEANVGKSCLASQFTRGIFIPEYKPTIGVDYETRSIELDGNKLRLQVWDSSGKKNFWPITKAMLRASNGVIVSYSVTDQSSFEAVNWWIDQIKEHCREDTKVVLVANKCDSVADTVVSFPTSWDFAAKKQIPLIEVSAKDGMNVELAFLTLLSEIRPVLVNQRVHVCY